VGSDVLALTILVRRIKFVQRDVCDRRAAARGKSFEMGESDKLFGQKRDAINESEECAGRAASWQRRQGDIMAKER